MAGKEPSFVNDWPAHLHHVEQYVDGTLDYASHMHHNGHNAYGATFVYIYSTLFKATGGSLRLFQCIWALLEVRPSFGVYLERPPVGTDSVQTQTRYRLRLGTDSD